MVLVLMKRENVNVSHFEKGIKEPFQLFNRNPHLVAYHWKGVITRKIITLRKDFYDVPGHNGVLLKLTSSVTLIGYIKTIFVMLVNFSHHVVFSHKLLL